MYLNRLYAKKILPQKLIKYLFIMQHMDRVRKEIEEYIFENGQEYRRLLMSKSFYKKLKKEAEENNFDVDLPNLEIKENTNYDFKLLP